MQYKYTYGFIFTLFLCLANFNSDAQQRFNLSLIVGSNFSQIDGDDISGYAIMAPAAGLGVETILGKKISLKTELLYRLKGSNGTTYLAEKHIFIKLQSLDIPIVFTFKDWLSEGDTPYYRLHFEGGIAYSRILNIRTLGFETLVNNINEHFTNNIFEINVGATYFISQHWAINARYNHALNNLIKTDLNIKRFQLYYFDAKVIYTF